MFKIIPQDIRETKKSFCSLPYTKLILNSYGYVSMCCHQRQSIGKLTEDSSLLDFWNSPLAKEIREKTSNNELHSVCTSWNNCPFMTMPKHQFEFEVYKKISYPTHLEICLPDKHCNIGGENPSESNPACIMCRRNFIKPNQPDLTDLFCRKTKEIINYLTHLWILGIAEPFWKDAVFDIFDKLDFDKYANNLTFCTNTNGTCLNEKTRNKFFGRVKKSEISWSLDSASRDTHIKIRRLDAFDLVVKNLSSFIEERDKFGGKENHKVTIYNNINMLNVHEMSDMVKMAHDLKVDRIFMLPTHDQSGGVKLGELILCKKNLKIFKKNSEDAMDLANRIGVKLIYTSSFDQVPPEMS